MDILQWYDTTGIIELYDELYYMNLESPNDNYRSRRLIFFFFFLLEQNSRKRDSEKNLRTFLKIHNPDQRIFAKKK